jgi:hypothetical protein
MFSQSPGDESYTLGTLTISKAEYANAEKINQIIDYLAELEENEKLR